MMVSIAKPSLMPFMKVMFAPEEFSNSSVQFSILENMIDEACGICSCLETTADEESHRTWPKSKVAVLLVDQTLGFCFLKSSSIICGLWSLIEKAIELSILSEEENIVSLHNGDDFLLQFAFQAVKEKTGAFILRHCYFKYIHRGLHCFFSQYYLLCSYYRIDWGEIDRS